MHVCIYIDAWICMYICVARVAYSNALWGFIEVPMAAFPNFGEIFASELFVFVPAVGHAAG